MGSSEIWDNYRECCIGNFTGEITHFQCNKSGIYPKFSLLYPCYSMLIPYSLTFVSVSMYVMYKNITLFYSNWRYTVTQILANKIVNTTFSLVPVKIWD